MDNVNSAFRIIDRLGYEAIVTEREIDGETVYALYCQNELMTNIQNLVLVKRNGVWLKHDGNLEGTFFTFWGGLIDEHLKNNPLYGKN